MSNLRRKRPKCGNKLQEVGLRSKPNRFPSTIVQAASGTTHEATAQCWYSQPCLWQLDGVYMKCLPDPAGSITWTLALELQADNVVRTCEDPNFVPGPEL